MLVFDGIVYSLKGEYSSADFWKHVFVYIVQKWMWAPWFLACLFVVNLLFYSILKVFHTLFRASIVCCVFAFCGYVYNVLGGEALIWNFDAALMAIVFLIWDIYIEIIENA